MKLTTKGRYAVTAMLDLALHDDNNRPVALSEISARQGISLSYLEQLFSKLRKNDLVGSLRGPGGGYKLSRKPADIAVSDVIRAVDENVDITNCKGQGNCVEKNKGRCLTHDLWHELSGQIDSFLSNISLKDMMTRSDVIEVATRQDKQMQRG